MTTAHTQEQARPGLAPNPAESKWGAGAVFFTPGTGQYCHHVDAHLATSC